MEQYKYLIKSSFDDFKRNKVRTLLTSLGIMVGVLSVVLLIALGLGLKNYIQGQFESLGANLLIIFPGNVFSEGSGAGGNFGAVQRISARQGLYFCYARSVGRNQKSVAEISEKKLYH